MVYPYWPEPDIPDYKSGKFGRWRCERTPHLKTTSAGYFVPVKEQPAGWMFKKDDTVWMSLTRMEIESQSLPIWRAKGHVVIAGLGMGFTLFNIMRKPDVSKVTLLEMDMEVIALMDKVSDWRRWPGNEKVELVIGNAFTFVPEEPVDFLYVDIWPNLGDMRTLEDTQRLQKNINAEKVCWWGQELDLISWCHHNDLSGVNRETWRRFARTTGLPLLEQNNVIYPRLALLAATLQVIPKLESKESRDKLTNVCIEILKEDPLDDLLKMRATQWTERFK